MARRRRKHDADVHGVLVVDKPRGPTSHDVVQWTRRVLGTSQVGHAGTLDPLATGVLVVAVGQATRLVPYLTADDKRYDATLRLGATTLSLDADGDITERRPVPELTPELIRNAAARFVGALPQRPPVVSAIKVEGRPLYERVRRGEDVSPASRDVVLHAIAVHGVDEVSGMSCAEALDVRLSLHTGKGYYVRSLGRDLAEALGTVGHLVALRRTASGSFGLPGALDGRLLAGVHDEACREATRAALRSIAVATQGLGHLAIDAEEAVALRHGRALRRAPDPSLAEGAVRAAVDPEGAVVAIVGLRDGAFHVERGFPVTGGPAVQEVG